MLSDIENELINELREEGVLDNYQWESVDVIIVEPDIGPHGYGFFYHGKDTTYFDPWLVGSGWPFYGFVPGFLKPRYRNLTNWVKSKKNR
jgi:hypothetical protein